MKIHLFLLFCLFSTNANAGEWTRVSDDTISFVGQINDDEMVKFKEVFSSEISRIVVNSPGGRTIVGLQIGQLISQQPIEVIVDGECISSCANYLFTAASKRTIKRGMVGFHGGLRPFVNGLLALEKRNYPNFILDLQIYLGLPFDTSKESTLNTFKYYQKMAAEEDAFFTKLEISQDLFHRTQRTDKGGKGKCYSFLFPKQATFKKFGYSNIVGRQDIQMIRNDPGLIQRADAGCPPLID